MLFILEVEKEISIKGTENYCQFSFFICKSQKTPKTFTSISPLTFLKNKPSADSALRDHSLFFDHAHFSENFRNQRKVMYLA